MARFDYNAAGFYVSVIGGIGSLISLWYNPNIPIPFVRQSVISDTTATGILHIPLGAVMVIFFIVGFLLWKSAK